MRLVIATVALVLAWAPAEAGAQNSLESGPVSYLTTNGTIAAGGEESSFSVCPPSDAVSGGGVAIKGSVDGVDDVDVASLYPGDFLDPDPTLDDLWTAWMNSEDSVSHDYTVTAICVKPSKVPMSYVTSSSSIGAGNFTSGGGVNCPSGTATSGGFDSSAASANLVELEELGHSFSGKDANYSGIQSGFGKDGAAMNYTTFAACTTADLKHVYVDKVLFGGFNTLKAKCPNGTRVLGGGFSRFPTDLIQSAPFDSKDAGKAPDDGWKVKTRYGAPAAGFTYAHCLD